MSLVHIMSCHLISTKPLSEPMLEYQACFRNTILIIIAILIHCKNTFPRWNSWISGYRKIVHSCSTRKQYLYFEWKILLNSTLLNLVLSFRWHAENSWWRHQIGPFYVLLALCVGNSLVNSSHSGQWHRTLIFSLICAGINKWVNNRGVGDWRRHCTHYDVIVMYCLKDKHVDEGCCQLTHQQLEIHGCLFHTVACSTVATEALVLKHQLISINSAGYTSIILD